MGERIFRSSLTRIADFGPDAIELVPVERGEWATGDYVVGEVIVNRGPFSPIELPNGRMAEVAEGDRVMGAFGRRYATLESVGDWRSIGPDGRMEALTSAGLFGRATSHSPMLPPLVELVYRGHVMLNGRAARMRDFVPAAPERELRAPVVLIIGTSMSAGKTTTARVLVRAAKALGLRVVGTKLTGAGRYRDILAMRDAGADVVMDFVDVGLPSTVCPADEYREALRALLARIAALDPELVIAEAGASPLEPYNGGTAVELLGDRVGRTVLCASDPYAVVGVMQAFGVRPDLVAGVATSTEAGVALTKKLADLPTLNLLRKENAPEVRRLLQGALDGFREPG